MSSGVVADPRLRNPFPGLRPFEADEADRFFGRQPQVRELLGTLRRTRFLSIVGSSGCGKSSLVRAGLVAALQRGFMVEEDAAWRIAIMRPGDSPIARLAEALTCALGDDCPEAHGLRLAALRAGPLGIVDAVHEAELPAGSRLFVLVDQFEELFRFADRRNPARTRDEARAFVKLLIAAAAARDAAIYVALTMRSEFLGDCAELPGLPERINQGLYLVPQMSRDALREAIVGPVAAMGGHVADRLADRLLNDLGDERDQLPILQHAMMRLWRRGIAEQERPPDLDLAHYAGIGNLSGALGGHLEEVFARQSPERQRATELLFRALTEQTDEKRTVRRPTRLDRLEAVTGLDRQALVDTIDVFRAEGRSFLMPGPSTPLTDETVIDISHESLIRQWSRLREWIAAEARESRLERRLHVAARDWDSCGREASYLYHGARLAEAEEWARVHPARLDALDREFLDASLALRHQQELARMEQQELPRTLAEAAASRVQATRRNTAYLHLIAAPADAQAARALTRLLRAEGREVVVPEIACETPAGADILRAAIDAADAVLVLISPDLVASTQARLSIDRAVSTSKRIIPVLWRRVTMASVHPALAPLAWVDLTAGTSLTVLPAELIDAIDADLPWSRAHARLLLRATEWQLRGRNTSLLLRGVDLKEAELWLTGNRPGRKPEVTPDQVAYIAASRRAAQRRLHHMAVAALVAIGLAGAVLVGFQQRRTAEQQREAAVEWAQTATNRLSDVLMRWGHPSPATASRAQIVRSLQANDLLQLRGDRNAGDRGGLVVRYYTDGPIQPGLERTLLGMGFAVDAVKREGRAGSTGGTTRNNALWFGSDVPVRDAQAVALALIRAGVDLRYIGRFVDSTGRERVLQIGTRPASASDPPLDLQQLDRAQDFPARRE